MATLGNDVKMPDAPNDNKKNCLNSCSSLMKTRMRSFSGNS